MSNKLPNGWKECKLGEVVYLNQRSIDSTYEYQNIVYLDTGSITRGRITDIKEYKLSEAPSRAKRLVKHNDIVYSTVRPIQRHYGIINNPPDNMVVSTGFVVIEAIESLVDPFFIYYFLTLDEIVEILDIIAEASTSAYPSLRPSDLENLNILLPPLPEQRAIASVLSSLDDKIDLLHRENKTLEAMAETLFRQWFIEEAKDDWEKGVIPDEFDFTMGLAPPGESYNEEGIGVPLYQGNADFQFRFPKKRVYTTDPKRFAEKYDALISVRAPVGTINMADDKCCIGRGIAAFRYKNNNSFYTYTYFKLRSLMGEIQQFNDEGTVFGSINKRDFESFEIVIPPYNVIVQFQNFAKPLDDKIIVNSIQIHTLEKLRDTLPPKLMSGEVRIQY